MNYPLLSEYITAIKSAEDNFNKLSNLRPELDEDGVPIMSSGNFAVVFKMRDEQTGKLHAVKCFLKEQEGRAEAYRLIAEELEFVSSTFLTPIRYLDKELFVDTNASDETEFPVLLMDWVEGVTLDKYIREHVDDEYELALLAYQFSRLAMWLMPQPFAHGDLKPDNILVREDGTLVLVDYDGMYVPAMKGQKARELGSPDFRHPNRTESDFDEHIDDFSLATILLSLKAISLQPSLLEEYGTSDRLLFSESDYRNLSECRIMDALKPLMQDAELSTLLSLYILSVSQKNLSQISFRLFNLSKPDKLQYKEVNLSTEVTEEDLDNAWTDEFGVQYSADRKRLLKAHENIINYSIKIGTKVICSGAFAFCEKLEDVIIPNSVTHIGAFAFSECLSLKKISNSKSLVEMSDHAFYDCQSLKEITIPSSITQISDKVFYKCKSLKKVIIPNSIIQIGYGAFWGCESIVKIQIPKSVTTIGSYAFSGCYALSKVSLTDIVEKIGIGAFEYCSSLKEIKLPNGLNKIEKFLFSFCCNLAKVTIPETVTSIGERAFEFCTSIKSIIISKNVASIGKKAFAHCKNLQKINIPNTIKTIRDSTFYECHHLRRICLPNSIKTIGEKAFKHCPLLRIVLPESLVYIGSCAFEECIFLRQITIPSSIKKIGYNPFVACFDLKRIICKSEKYVYHKGALYSHNMKELILCLSNVDSFSVPDSVTKIKNGAFDFGEFGSLRTIFFPDSIETIDYWAFGYSGWIEGTCSYHQEILVTIPKGSYERFEMMMPNVNYELKEV